jgi:hypothetical protein
VCCSCNNCSFLFICTRFSLTKNYRYIVHKLMTGHDGVEQSRAELYVSKISPYQSKAFYFVMVQLFGSCA